jgi:hypothetical protein
MRERTIGFQTIIKHLENLLYIKDIRLEGTKKKLNALQQNVTRVVNSKVYEKGNALVFELDRATRETSFYQKHLATFESEMREALRLEFKDALEQKDLTINLQKKNTFDMINSLISEFKALGTQQEIENIEKIRMAKEKCLLDSQSQLSEMVNKGLVSIGKPSNTPGSLSMERRG